MKICKENHVINNTKYPQLIKGNLYENINNGYIYIYNQFKDTLVNLVTGDSYATNGYGIQSVEDKWKNVTDQYCLQKIK